MDPGVNMFALFLALVQYFPSFCQLKFSSREQSFITLMRWVYKILLQAEYCHKENSNFCGFFFLGGGGCINLQK